MTQRWRHQEEAFQFLKDKPAGALFMDMGTGKSKVTIDLLEYWGCKTVLVICPKRAIDVWPTQLGTHASKPYQVHTLDDGATKGAAYLKGLGESSKLDPCVQVVVVNYESAWRKPLEHILLGIHWDLVILDESHKIKAAGSIISRFCAKLGKKKSKRRLILTGTPMADKPLDVYGQFRFLDPDIFGTNFKNFQNQYAIMGGFNNYEIRGYQNLDRLHDKVYQVGFRVKSEDVLDLPPTQDVVRTCDIEPRTRKMYNDLKKDMIAELEGSHITAPIALTKLLRLQQLANGLAVMDDGPPQVVDTSKLELLMSMLEQVPPDEPVVIFCLFTHDIESITRKLCDLDNTPAILSGNHNKLKQWQDGLYQHIIVQMKSGSAAVDLTRARYVIYYSVGTSLADYQQSRKRTHRPGQTRPVTYYHLRVVKSVDMTIAKLLDKKEAVVTSVLDLIKG